jgi:hypothetical protein
MTIEQTLEIPKNHRITLEIPEEIPAGMAHIALTVSPNTAPKYDTDHTPNAETMAAFEEGDAMLRGEIPSAVRFDPTRYKTKEELKAALTEILLS